jgi:acetyl-CoA carboxylase carboxyl transferase subunit alpha
MGVTSIRLEELGIVDNTIAEPLGGAHRNVKVMARHIKQQIAQQLDELSRMDTDKMLERRYRRLMSHGAST